MWKGKNKLKIFELAREAKPTEWGEGVGGGPDENCAIKTCVIDLVDTTASESEMYLFDPHKKCIQSNNEKI